MTGVGEQIARVVVRFYDLVRDLNSIISERIVSLISPIFGETVARVLVYLILIAGTLYAIKSSSSGWVTMILLIALIVLLVALLTA
ncbi:MAG: hypothetical protein QXP84_05840 [Candidatus Korarchaeum sp.]